MRLFTLAPFVALVVVATPALAGGPAPAPPPPAATHAAPPPPKHAEHAEHATDPVERMMDARLQWQATRPRVTRFHPVMEIRNAARERQALSSDETVNLRALAARRAQLNGIEAALKKHAFNANEDEKLTLDDVKWLVGMATSEQSQRQIVEHVKTMRLEPAAAAFVGAPPKLQLAGGKDFVQNLADTSVAQHGKISMKDWRTIAALVTYAHVGPGGIPGRNGPLTDPHVGSALTRRGVELSKQLLARDAATPGGILEPDVRAEVKGGLDRQADAVDMSEPDFRGPGPFG